METKELNKDFKEEVNKIFAALFKEIGSNRQQLANKVLSHHKDIYKELNREEVSDERRKEMLSEVGRIVKMAAQQLPHLKMNTPKPASSPETVPAKSSVDKPVKMATPPTKAQPPKAPSAPPAKVASKAKPVTAKSKSAPQKKTGSKPAKKKK